MKQRHMMSEIEARRFLGLDNSTQYERRLELYQSPSRELGIKFPKPSQGQIERARRDYEEFCDIP